MYQTELPPDFERELKYYEQVLGAKKKGAVIAMKVLVCRSWWRERLNNATGEASALHCW